MQGDERGSQTAGFEAGRRLLATERAPLLGFRRGPRLQPDPRQRPLRAIPAPPRGRWTVTKAPVAIGPDVVNGIGASSLRKEDWPLVRGEGTFIADFKRPGMVHAFVVRSPLAHARFTTIDRKAALGAPGVLDVITVDDL